MGDDSSVCAENLRANWTQSQDQYFLELLLSHVHKGNKTGKGFSRQAWADMIEQFNTKFGLKYDVDVLKNRHKRFRKQYNDIKMLLNQSGFKWDVTLNMVVGDDRTWDEYIKAHPDLQGYRTRAVPHYNDLVIICGHAIADGRYSLSCFDVDFECEETASKEMDDQSPTSKGVDNQTHKIDWSPMMDQFFVELMLDQVRKGNKIGRTFKKKTWADMIESFNNRFENHYGKVVLKNRFNVLRRHYNSIKVLLSKEGFSWDETQQKVLADDQFWHQCIKVNHNFRLYRIKSMPFYPSMCIICRNEATPGRKKTACCDLNIEKGFSEGKNSIPDAQPLSDANEGALHIGGGNNTPCETPPTPDVNIGALCLGGEKPPARGNQPFPDADKRALQLGNEKNAHDHLKRKQLGNEKNAHDHLKRKQPQVPQTLKESKKGRIDEGMANALKNMAAAVQSLSKKPKKEDSYSVANVISALQAIPDMDDDLILDGVDFLEDERRARMFLALDANLRKKWLLRKLRPE